MKRQIVETVRQCVAAGYTLSETERETGIANSTLRVYEGLLDLDFRRDNRGGRRHQANARSLRMVALYRQGNTLNAIGLEYGITRERVRQIIGMVAGINRKGGGQSVATKRSRAERAAKRDADTLAQHGCTWAQFNELRVISRQLMVSGVGRDRTPLGALKRQKQNARSRLIPWELNLWQWWTIWQQSGKWDQRGRTGYVMARVGDDGPYSERNVYITTSGENIRDGAIVRLGRRKYDLPRGVRPSGKRFSAHRMKGGQSHRLGTFDTPEEAHAAYLEAAPSNGTAA